MPVNLERRALVALGLLWLGGVRAFASIDVTGLWSDTVRTGENEVTGDQMLFTTTEVMLINGILVDFKCEIDGSKMKLTAERQGLSEEYDFEVDGNKMLMTFVDTTKGPVTRVMTRRGQPRPGAHPIVGEWTWPLLGTLRCVQRFSLTGDAQFAIPFEVQKGAYRIEGETLHIELARQLPRVLTVRREGNMLTTLDETRKETRFVKFEY